MPPRSHLDPHEVEPTTEAEIVAKDQCELIDQFAESAAIGQSDTVINCEGLTIMSTKPPPTLSIDFKDATECLPTTVSRSAVEEESNNFSDKMPDIGEDVGKSMGQEDLGVITACASTIGNDNNDTMDRADQKDIEPVMQTDCGTAEVSPQTPTTGSPRNSKDHPKDSDDTATAMQTPEETSTESTTNSGSVDEDAERGRYADDVRQRKMHENPPIDRRVDPHVLGADKIVESPSKQEVTASSTLKNSQKIEISKAVNEGSPHATAKIDTVLEGHTRIEIAKCSRTDSDNDGISDLPAADLDHHRGTNVESTESDGINENEHVSEDATKSATAARSIPLHLRPDRLVLRPYNAPVARVSGP
jgi:hypothetical protein